MKDMRQTEKSAEQRTVLHGFELKPDFAKTYKPTLIGKGGEHLVFSLEGKPSLVAKVHMRSIERFYPATLHGVDPLHGYQHRWQEYLSDHRERRQDLREAFGAEHVLTQKVFLAKVPFVSEMKFALKQLAAQNAGLAPDQVWAIVNLQKKSELLNQAATESITSGYAEMCEGVDDKYYTEATQKLLNGDAIPEHVFRLIQGTKMTGLLDAMKRDPDIRDTVKQVAEGAIRFTQKTPYVCIDLAGAGNIVVGKKQGKATFEIIDPFAGKLTIDQVQDAWRRFTAHQVLRDSDRRFLLNGVNYLRTINGLAALSGSAERLPLLPEGVQLSRPEGRRLLEELSRVE
jgi:hypothetical protein